jgi:hypothetical protein
VHFYEHIMGFVTDHWRASVRASVIYGGLLAVGWRFHFILDCDVLPLFKMSGQRPSSSGADSTP